MILLFQVQFAFAGDVVAPRPVTLDPDEQAEIDARKIVIRFDDDQSTAGQVTGILDLRASPAIVWAAIFDFEARVAEIGPLKSASTYAAEGFDVSARWVISAIGTQIVFHANYAIHERERWCTYALDDRKENDLLSVDGSYQVYPQGSGTRLIYRSASDSGRSVPGWVKRWLAVDTLTEQLEGVRGRAEKTASR